MVKPIPQGYHAITPNMTFKDTQRAIHFYEMAFGAKVLNVMPALHGHGIMHAAIQIGDSILMMGDEMDGGECKSAETMGGSPITLFIYVKDVDAAFDQAVDAGCAITMPVMDMFWGDRSGNLRDPFGYAWMIATHIKDLSEDEMRKGAEQFFEQMAK